MTIKVNQTSKIEHANAPKLVAITWCRLAWRSPILNKPQKFTIDLETPLPPWQPQTAKVMHPSHFLPESLVTGIWPEQGAQHTIFQNQKTTCSHFVEKNQNKKNCQFGYFKYPKEVAVKESVKELVVIKVVICFFPIFENHGYIWDPVRFFFWELWSFLWTTLITTGGLFWFMITAQL